MDPDPIQQPLKTTFCRFYLRGLCILPSAECTFAHGVHDLNYLPMQPGQIVVYDYLQDNDVNQRKVIKGPRIYKNLYEWQGDNIVYTLEELNEDRIKRLQIRKSMHQKLFQDFMQLLEWTYPQQQLTEQFLIQEYTRAGFNKLMTRIKFSHLTDHLCESPTAQFYKDTVNKTAVIKRRAFPQVIDEFYKNMYLEIINGKEGIEQSQVKKQMFIKPRQNKGIPPLQTILKERRVGFGQFIKMLMGEELSIKMQATQEQILQCALDFLKIECTKRLLDWNQVYKYLSKHLKLNNGNVINQIKPNLILHGYFFLSFPMVNFILPPDGIKIDLDQISQCECDLKKLYTQEELMVGEKEAKLDEGESVDIVDWESLMHYAPNILQSHIIGVDLEGRLRKNGYIQMIQLNNGRNTFLFDIYQMDLNGDVDTFEQSRKILRNVMSNPKILKVLHDCRHDSLALHQFMKCCIVNVFDSSAVETYRGQLTVYDKVKEGDAKSAKQAIAVCTNIKTPGLNQILKNYEAPHGINKNKDLFHKMWSKGQTSFFDQRPLDPDYRQYCIKDVLDLPIIYKRMLNWKGNAVFQEQVAKWISGQYSRWGYKESNQHTQNKEQ